MAKKKRDFMAKKKFLKGMDGKRILITLGKIGIEVSKDLNGRPLKKLW